MELPSKDLLGLFNTLVPGFLAAWVFYGLTAHPKKTPFERTIQALIFTLFVQVMTFCAKSILEIAAERGWRTLGPWNQSVALTWSVVNAILLGGGFAVFANKDWIHRFARFIGVTKRMSYPSEWYSAFDRNKRYLILHLKGSRRLHGWAEEWPDQPDSGHFVVQDPIWLLADDQCAPLYNVERMLIPATEVELVEFMKIEKEVSATAEQLDAAQKLLNGLHGRGEKNDGN